MLRSADMTAVADVRRALRELLTSRSWGGSGGCDTAELLTSEIVTNALVHTNRGAEVTATLLDGFTASASDLLRVEVRDFVARPPRMRVTDCNGTHGRGLMLVQTLADEWGVRSQGAGKVVWFELYGGPA
ncbi:ATP-binding protein [Streptomyces meridianus]|uniref:ATP-binding protein n=1 Tax=Streptomyces meridianus TaxID=2938945 RepID=A0ABT0X5F3_9ACTN|nr:ATP-binding protein [Streptomyces meridianus]MCM2576887.1 ATP-binding protein [Streptomyces meridianus]